MSLSCKTKKNSPPMYDVPNKENMKFCTICLCHNVAMNQKVVGQKLFNAVYTS